MKPTQYFGKVNDVDVDTELRLAESLKSFGWETNFDWKQWVIEPIILYPLAPREARAALFVMGELKNKGINIITILERIRKEYNK